MRAHLWLSFALLISPLVSACSPTAADTTKDGQASAVRAFPSRKAKAATSTTTAEGPSAPASEYSYIGQTVIQALSTPQGHLNWQNRTWGTSDDNELNPGWLLQTPLEKYWGAPVADLPLPQLCAAGTTNCDPDYQLRLCTYQADCDSGICAEVLSSVTKPNGIPRKMCTGHSDSIYDEFYKQMISGQDFVDVSSFNLPDGRFPVAMRNAITYLANRTSPPQVRLLFGNSPGSDLTFKIDDVLHTLTRDVPASSAIRVFVGQYRYNVDSFNHSKIVAVDGKSAIIGGENLLGTHYMNLNPVHDVSMRISGSAAVHAHLFLNELWAFTCNNKTAGGAASTVALPTSPSKCPIAYDAFLAPSGNGHTKVITVGRLGRIGDNASDDARIAMISAAKKTVRISQQDLGPLRVLGIAVGGTWPFALFAELGKAMGRGVDVTIVVSNQNAVAGGLKGPDATYSNNWSVQDVAAQLRTYLLQHGELLPAGTIVDKLLCSHFRIAPLRSSMDDQWPDGNVFANHAKTFIVDDKAFYIGSHNLYAANLAEYGVIVDDESAAQEMVASYWSKVWEFSSRVAISGAASGVCPTSM